MSDDTRTIHARMADAMSAISAVAKSDPNQSQNFNFRGIDAVLNTVGPVLREHKIVLLPVADPPTLDTYQTRNGATMTHAILPVTIRFCGPEGDEVECRVIGEAADAGDKVLSKAHSVALRIALLQVFAIPTDEPDPDASSHERAPAPDPDREAQAGGWENVADRGAQWKALREESAALKADHPELAEPIAGWVKTEGIREVTFTRTQADEWSNRLDEAREATTEPTD